MDAQSTKEIHNNKITMSDEYHQATALPKELLTRLEKAGVKKFTLQFQGGSDEGYLEIRDNTEGVEGYKSIPDEVYEDVQEWAYKTIGYSGAGDGHEYGDNFTYDLVEQTVTHDEWYMEQADRKHPTRNFSELGEKSPSVWW